MVALACLFFRWLNAHEGLATWVGAAATFAAVLVALIVALAGAGREDKRRQEDQLQNVKAVVAGIYYALGSIDGFVYAELDKAVKGDRLIVPTKPFSKILDTSRSALQYSLSVPFADEELLRIGPRRRRS